MEMLLIFITLGFYFNAWGKKQNQVYKLLAIHCPLRAKAQKTNKHKKPLASQITATSGALVWDIFYPYTCALKIRFNNNKNPIQLAQEGRILVDNWTTVLQIKLFTPAE